MTTMATTLSEVVRLAIAEDVGTGDITTQLTVPEDARLRGAFVAREEGIVAGLGVVDEVYRQIDGRVAVAFPVTDGAAIEPGMILCEVRGPAQAILTGERVALNFLQRLSGIATKTARFVALVEGTKTRIVDTRKTTPGMRALEKYAVRVGGGGNHRSGLYDAILIKDNHIDAAGGIREAVQAAFAGAPHTMTITVECDTLEQLDEAVDAGADFVLLDNMDPTMMAQAVDRAGGQVSLEASGGITEDTVAEIAQTGVDIISVGALTHSAPAIDIGLDIVPW
jgi:nicotinate-nucleotide pyrophosphorylase (carboxylating)